MKAFVLTLAGLLLTPTAMANFVYFQDDFEDNNTGNHDVALTGPTVGSGYTVNDDGAAARVTIIDSPALDTRALHLVRGAGNFVNAVGNITGASTTDATDQVVNFDFSVWRSGSLGLISIMNGSTEVIRLNFLENGTIQHYNGSANTIGGISYDLSTWQDVSLVVDFLDESFTIEVDGDAADGPITSFWNSSSTFTGVRWGVGGNSTLNIDNVEVYRVPEPASLALLGLGGLAILSRRRARSH